MAEVKPDIETFAKIKVIGIGGGGGSAVNRMIKSEIKGVDFIAINTDVQALGQNLAMTKIAIGKTLTRGLGAGMNPDIGARAAEENQNDIRNALNGGGKVIAGVLRYPLWKFMLIGWVGKSIKFIAIVLAIAWGWEALLRYLG